MVLRKAFLALALAASACDESLFDAHVGGKDGGAGGDATSLCPAPCVGDAVHEFSAATQGGTSARWRYRSDGRAENGADYADMTAGVVVPGLSGRVSSGTPAAAIGRCDDDATASACSGLADHLLVLPTQTGAGARDPVLVFTVPEAGVYRLTGRYRIPDGGTAGVMQNLLVSRNARHDYLFVQGYSPSLTPGSFDLEVEAALGDQLMIHAVPLQAGAASPLGVRFFASRAETVFPGRCQYAATFEGEAAGEQLRDRCTGSAWTNVGGTPVPSASPELGTAWQLGVGDHVDGHGGVIDRSGDFTVQFWFKDLPPEGGGNPPFESIFSDYDCAAQGGMWLTVQDWDPPENNWDLIWAYHDTLINWCPDNYERIRWTQELDFTRWHFYRIVRSTADDTLRVCVDGVEVGQAEVPGDLDLTGDDAPFLGKDEVFGTLTTGIIDDFRAFTRALPCDAR